MTMPKHNIFTTAFAKVYPLYIKKAERKNRTKDEVEQIICWLMCKTSSVAGGLLLVGAPNKSGLFIL
jgi:hypothetical protein